MAQVKAARKNYQRDVGYIAKSVSYNTPGIGTTANICVGTLPAGCLHTETFVRVTTAFNAATTNVVTVGTTATSDAFVNSTDVSEASADLYISDRGIGANYTADTPVWVKYTQTGTAATAGAADVVLTYIPVMK